MRNAAILVLLSTGMLWLVQAAEPAKPAYDAPPLPLNRVAPYYPDRARILRFEGTVVVECVVRKDGSLGESKVVKSSGNDFLDYSAAFALTQWNFTPARRGKKLIETRIRQEFSFIAASGKSPTTDRSSTQEKPDELAVEMNLDKRCHAEVLLALDKDQRVIWMKLLKSSGRLEADFVALKSSLGNFQYKSDALESSKPSQSVDWVPERVRPSVVRVIIQPFDFQPAR